MSTNEKHLRGKDGGLGFSRGREATESSPIFMGVMGGKCGDGSCHGICKSGAVTYSYPLLQNPKAGRFLNQHCSMEAQGSRHNSPPSLSLHHISPKWPQLCQAPLQTHHQCQSKNNYFKTKTANLQTAMLRFCYQKGSAAQCVLSSQHYGPGF